MISNILASIYLYTNIKTFYKDTISLLQNASFLLSDVDVCLSCTRTALYL